MNAADRILKGIRSRVANFETIDDINSYFASDLMIDKVRDIVDQLKELGESVKVDDIQSRLKSIREDTVRQLQGPKMSCLSMARMSFILASTNSLSISSLWI